MTTENKNEYIKTLGSYIRTMREQQQISIRDISVKTKIRTELLTYLEEDNFSKLPSRVYILGFLKSIVEVLRLDYTLTLELFDKTVIEKINSKPNAIDLPKQTLAFKLPNITASSIGIILTVIVLCILFILNAYQAPNEKNTFASYTSVPIEKNQINNIVTSDVNQFKNKHPSPVINLSIEATNGDCWIAYQIDDKPIVKYLMKKGKTIKLSAKKIKLQLGNYKVVKIKQNDSLFVVNKNSKSTTAHLIFPKHLAEIFKPPFFIFDKNGSVRSKDTQRNEITKDI